MYSIKYPHYHDIGYFCCWMPFYYFNSGEDESCKESGNYEQTAGKQKKNVLITINSRMGVIDRIYYTVLYIVYIIEVSEKLPNTRGGQQSYQINENKNIEIRRSLYQQINHENSLNTNYNSQKNNQKKHSQLKITS